MIVGVLIGVWWRVERREKEVEVWEILPKFGWWDWVGEVGKQHCRQVLVFKKSYL